MKPQPTLESRIVELRRECGAFVKAYAEVQAAPGGLPVQVIERMIYQRAEGDPCLAALEVIFIQRRDEEIAKRPSAPARPSYVHSPVAEGEEA